MITNRKLQSLKRMYVNVLLAGFFLVSTARSTQININLPGLAPVQQDCAVTLNGSNPSNPFVCEDVYYMNQAGQPQIPWAMVSVLLSPQADLENLFTEVVEVRYTPAAGQWSLAPAAPMFTWREDGSEVVIWPDGVDPQTGRDTGIYQTNAFWPTESARIADAGMIRTYKVARVGVPLARYNPVSGVIELLERIELTLNYASPAAAEDAASAALAGSDPIGREWVSAMAANFSSAGSLYETMPAAAAADGEAAAAAEEITTVGYTIITTDYIAQNSAGLQEFIAHKELFYYDVQVITETDFGGGSGDTAANNIRAWLQAHYLTDNIKYVLLIGDPRPFTGTVPMKAAYAMYNSWLIDSQHPEYTPTDHYYAELTGDWDKDNDGRMGEGDHDFGANYANGLNEVIVGRIPYYDSLDDLNSILRKTIAYERQSGAAADWRKNCLLPMKPLNEADPSWPLGEDIKDNHLVPHGWGYYRIYDTPAAYPPPGYEATPCNYANTTNAWKSSPYYGLVIWQTHGGYEDASQIFSTTYVSQLNDNYPSFTFQASCWTGRPESTNNLAYAILKNGGIGTIGATRVSYGGPWETHGYNNQLFIGGLAYEYAERLVGLGMSGGEALANYRRDLNGGVGIASDWHNLIVFNLYGDPSVRIEPKVMIPTITPPSGEFFPSVTAEAYFPDVNWLLRYTTDGSDPDQSDPVYTGPLTFTESTTFKVRAYSDDLTPVCLDILDRDYTGAQYVASGFTGWTPYNNASITINGVTVTRSISTHSDYLRTIPVGTPGKTLYQDCYYGTGDAGLDLTVTGLAPSTSYQVSFYCYDYYAGIARHIETKWYGNGTYMFTAIFDRNVLPTTEDQFKNTAIVKSDAAGQILFDSVKGACNPSTVTEWANISAIIIEPAYSAVATETYIIPPGEIFVDDNAPNDPGAGDPSVSDPLEDGSSAHPFDAIQEAMDFAVSGVTVTVLPGTYTGTGNRNIDFNGKNIILRSTDPTNPQVVAATVINCENLGRGLLLDNSETSATSVQGLTITNGYTSSGGGGIYCFRSSPVIENCRIVNCTAGTHGGGLFLDGGAATLRNNVMRGCHGLYGGGIYAKGNAHPTVLNCVLADNTAGSGGAVCVVSANMTFEQVTLANNITYNSQPGSLTYGGAAYMMSSNLSWLNCILWGNTADQGPALYLSSSSTAAFDYCDVQNGASGFSLSGTGNSYTLSTGCYDMDPLFADAANGDYHLQSAAGRWNETANDWVTDTQTSPALDTAHPAQGIGAEIPDTGNLRKNLGAYGGTAKASRTPLNWSVGCDVNNDGVADLLEWSLLAGQWQQTGSGLISDFEGNGSVTITDLLLLCEDWLGATGWAQ